MALSQIQCLDDNHVNPRTHESKPEFLYCEDQRLALEALLRDGREAFFKYLEVRGLRGFLSDPELEALAAAVEPYDPGSELFPESAEENEPPLSLHYWPELSDTSIPQMDLGWPDCEAYRGVTRTTMYSQPPLDGQAHIKEIIRKMIAQAQKVIAVVMDVFTDVDIFRDLLDAGFKRRISVYILLERTTLPHFLSMCQRANMHAGHLKHLRVRCTQGVDFHTRTSTKVRGRMGHRFMFIDGDKAVSGSYSFTWMSSRLEKNLITVVTGQAVDAFDRLFRVLYVTSTSVDLRRVATEPEPEPEPLPQPAAVAPPSAALARKLYNPKYALALGNPSPSSSPSPTPTPTPSAGCNSPKQAQSQENSEVPDAKKGRRQRVNKEPVQEAPPLHPGLVDLEKACLMSYLPTWPEPDPPSDVIGFINIRDTSKPTPVHLQRSEMFGTSQAIRFSSPISVPKEDLPEVATPRQAVAKQEETNKPQPAQGNGKAEEAAAAAASAAQPIQPGDIQNGAATPQQNPPASAPTREPDKNATEAPGGKDEPHSNTPANQDAGHKTTPHLKADAPPQSNGGGASAPNAQAVSANSPKPDPLPGSDAKEEKSSLNTNTSAAAYRTRTLEADSTQSSAPRRPADSGLHTQTKTPPPPHTQAAHTQPQNSSKMTPNAQTPIVNSHAPPSSTSAKCPQPVSPTPSGNKHISTTTSTTTTTNAPLSSISSASSLPPLTPSSSSTTVNPPLLSSSTSSSLASSPPVPKPRTVQLVIKNGVPGDHKLPELDAAERPETAAVRAEPAAAAVAARMASEKVPESVPESRNCSESKTGAQKETEKTGNIKEAAQQKPSEALRETKNEEAVEARDDRAGTRSLAGTDLEAQSVPLITDAPKAEKIQGVIPKDVEPETLTSVDGKLPPQIESAASAQAGNRAPERATASCEVAAGNGEDATQHKTDHASAPDLRKSTSGSAQRATGVSETADSLKSPKLTPAPATHTPKDGAGDGTTAAQPSDPRSPPPQSPPPANPAEHTREKSTPSPLSDDPRVADLRSPTFERDSPLARTPTPDGLLPPPRTPTPDSRTHTPDSRSSDFRTPTPLSDGYASPRTDSALSTTSDEYYECSSSPLHEPVLDRAAQRGRGTTEDHVSLTHSNAANATAVATSSACKNSNAATLSATETSAFSGETQSLPGPACISSSSSLLERKAETGEKEAAANEENGGEAREKRGRTEGRAPGGTQRRGSEEAKRTADHLKQGKGPTETVESNKEAKPPKRQKVLNQSAAERLADGGVTPGKLTNEVAEPKRSSAGDLKLKKEGGKPDKEKAAERRSRPQSTREAEGQKLSYSSVRSSGGKQQDGEASSPSRPSRPPRAVPSSALGPRPWGSRQLGQPESKALHGSFQLLDNAASPRRPPSRPPPPAGSAAGRRQPEVSQTLQSLQGLQGLLSRQPQAAQGRASAAQSPGQLSYLKPQTSFLHSHHPLSRNRTASAHEAHSQEDGKLPFSLTFSRLYNLKGLKDKMSKLPAPSKRGSGSSPVQGHKSSS